MRELDGSGSRCKGISEAQFSNRSSIDGSDVWDARISDKDTWLMGECSIYVIYQDTTDSVVLNSHCRRVMVHGLLL